MTCSVRVPSSLYGLGGPMWLRFGVNDTATDAQRLRNYSKYYDASGRRCSRTDRAVSGAYTDPSMRCQVSLFREDKRLGRLDLAAAFEVVSERIRRATLDSSKQMTGAGIRHALVGGLAVGAHGWPRATKDVDFLVGSEAWVRHPSGIVTPHPGLPLEAHGVAIDSIPVREDEPHLQAALDGPLPTPEGVPVAPVEVLVYLKLKSPRARDEADVIELVRSGVDVTRIRSYLAASAPGLVERFDAMVARARADDEAEG